MAATCKYKEYCMDTSYCRRSTSRPPKLFLVSPSGRQCIRVKRGCFIPLWTIQGTAWRKAVNYYLSRGWKFSPVPVGEELPVIGSREEKELRYAPKKTPEVRPATVKMTEAFHGGDSASGEVVEPEVRQGGLEKEQRKRGRRGGSKDKGKSKFKLTHVKLWGRGGGGSTPSYCPPGYRPPTKEEKEAARRAAELFLRWIGTGEPQEEEGFDILGFIKAAEVGEDLRPYIEADLEREETVRIIITPDQSGSTCSWSDVSTAFAYALQEKGARLGVQVVLVPNFNGNPVVEDQYTTWAKVIPPGIGVDVVLYLGDDDARESLQRVPAAQRIVALSNAYSAVRDGKPRFRQDVPGVVWIEGVAGQDPESFIKALEMLGSID